METFGQFGPIVIHPRKQVTGKFKLNKLQNINKIERPCESDPTYSYRNCLMELAEKNSNCSIKVFTNKFNCSSTGLDSLIAILTSLRGSAENDVVFDTGCVPKCQNLQYKFDLKDETDVTWRKDWVSSFYLSTDSTTYQISTEYYSYDLPVSGLSTKIQALHCSQVIFAQDLIGSVGGYLGLFLGWSIMSLITSVPSWSKLLWSKLSNSLSPSLNEF